MIDGRSELHPLARDDTDAALALQIVQDREEFRLVIDRPDVSETDGVPSLCQIQQFRGRLDIDHAPGLRGQDVLDPLPDIVRYLLDAKMGEEGRAFDQAEAGVGGIRKVDMVERYAIRQTKMTGDRISSRDAVGGDIEPL